MKQLRYCITTLSPLLITSNTGDPNMVSTKEYIPGTNILGVFARMYIRKENLTKAHKDDNFRRWFLDGSLKFTNAYIVSYDDKNNIKNNIPLPISIQKDKDDETKIYDLLFTEDEDIADKTTKIIGGFGNIVNSSLYTQEIKKSLNFHHERDTDKGTTKKGMIFNYESINAGQTFEGAIIGEENDLKTFFSFFGNNFEINIGRSRSAQYGRVSFKFSDTPEDISVNSATGEVALTLLSDTIIYNEQGFSTTDIRDFKKALRAKLGDSVEIKKSFVKTGEIENFVSVWKLRKPSETCFLMGSCFLISGVSDIDKLKELQISGIGERTHEGFGRVKIGIQTDTQLVKRDYDEAPSASVQLPPMAKEIATVAVKNYIQRIIKVTALKEYERFAYHKKLPTKSLIARLEMSAKTKNREAFIEYLDKLRDTAKDKLRKCHNGSATLLEFLKEKEIRSDETIMKGIKDICTTINYEPDKDTVFINSLYRLYFETFFGAMRKAKKAEKEG